MNSDKIKILFLASDPSDASRLRLGQEFRDIQEKLQLAKYRDKFMLEPRMSVRPGDISQAILDIEPHIIHFSGHGEATGELCFENELGKNQPVTPDALAALFALVDEQINCVVLNACYSEIQAKAISEHINFVIGMNRAIGDKAAIAFAIGFYKALGANRSFNKAYKFGCAEIQIQGISEHLTPILYEKKYLKKIEPAKYILVLSATINEIDKPRAEALIAHLRQISGDASLTLQRIEAGSVKLVLEGSPEGLEQILTLFNAGKLTEVLGIPVQGVEVIGNQEQAIAPSTGFRIATEQSQVLIEESTQTVAEELAKYWHLRLAIECPKQSIVNRESIVIWLLGSDRTRFDAMSSKDLDIAKQAMQYRWRILQQRYLGKGRDAGYRNLMSRLASLVTLRNKIQTWISLSRDRKRSVLDVLQEIIQELLQSDNYMLAQMASITHLTGDSRLKDALLFASVEEYCLRPIRNQPLLAYRFTNYLRRTQRGGLTQVPGSDLIKLVSEEILTNDNDNRINLLESQAIASQKAQNLEEQQTLEIEVQQEFENYLRENQGDKVPEWLEMYLAV